MLPLLKPGVISALICQALSVQRRTLRTSDFHCVISISGIACHMGPITRMNECPADQPMEALPASTSDDHLSPHAGYRSTGPLHMSREVGNEYLMLSLVIVIH